MSSEENAILLILYSVFQRLGIAKSRRQIQLNILRMAVPFLFREPLHVPSAETLDIFDDYLESVEVESCHGVKCNIEEDQSPFEEGIDRVS
jgi:hypothetical protein